MLENTTEISKEDLLTHVQNMMYEGYRFATASCVENTDETIDVYYHFDKNLEIKNLKINVSKDEEIQSISKIYFCALLVENEMKELFGLNIVGIVIDYGGHMLLSDDSLGAPMLKNQITIEKKGGEEDG